MGGGGVRMGGIGGGAPLGGGGGVRMGGVSGGVGLGSPPGSGVRAGGASAYGAPSNSPTSQSAHYPATKLRNTPPSGY